MTSRHQDSRPGIYRIRHRESGKTYIGQASNLRTRLKHHVWALTSGRHDNHYLQAAWNKYGPDAFEFSVIVYCRVPLLTENEQAALEGIPVELRYNVGAMVDAPNLGRKFAPEHRAKIGNGNRGKKRTAEHKAKYSAAFRGGKKTMTPARRASDALRGERSRKMVVVVWENERIYFRDMWLAADFLGVKPATVLQAIHMGYRSSGGRIYYANKDGSIKEPSK